jgi:Mrp family chromosome partitioning ATPase
MSKLDQAIFKAYAKDGRSVASPTGATGVLPVYNPGQDGPATARPTAGARTIDQIYHDGVLYRVEGQPIESSRQKQIVPAPHLSMLPPTSPRRAVRRSMLRMLSANAATASAEAVLEAPPRIARKVIIRHISHSAAPPPLGMLRTSRDAGLEQGELPPETITNEPMPSAPTDPSPVTPPIAPLNIATNAIQSFDIRGDWDHEAAISPMVLVADVRPNDATSMLVNVQLQSLGAIEQSNNTAASTFIAKSLEDRDEPQIRVRFDAPHAHDLYRPHARFSAPTDSKQPGDQPVSAVAAEELTFADAPAEALASDLIPSTADVVDENLAATVTEPVKSAVPLWEIDRFHWPRTCEKLFADEHSYLLQAGVKLQAAMQDGLKVLAITGSRRGEGRSTLALCLARAAAKEGIQAAVMDCDFARPQLASKVGLEIAHGWQEAALGNIPLSEAAVKSVADQITLLPLESSAATRALSLADPRVTATIRAAAATFELLILDLGPLGAGAEVAFPPGEGCPLDAAIVVRDLRFATAAESEAIGHTLQDAGVEAVGIAENFVIEEEIPATSA